MGLGFSLVGLSALTLHWQNQWSKNFAELEATKVLEHRLHESAAVLEQHHIRSMGRPGQLLPTSSENLVHLPAPKQPRATRQPSLFWPVSPLEVHRPENSAPPYQLVIDGATHHPPSPNGRPWTSERRLGGGNGRPRGHGRNVIPFQPPSKRLLWVFGLLCLALGGLAIRLVWLQVVQGEALQEKAREIQTQAVKPLGKRRTIVDRAGRMVAIDEERFTLWAHPKYFSFLETTPTPDAAPRRSQPNSRRFWLAPKRNSSGTWATGRAASSWPTIWIQKPPNKCGGFKSAALI